MLINRLYNSGEKRWPSRVGRLTLGTILVTLSLVLGLTIITEPMTAPTDAHWNASATAVSEFEAAVPPPRLTRKCEYVPGVRGLGAHVKIYWAAPEGFSLENAQLLKSSSGLGTILAPITGFSFSSQTQATSEGYETTVPTGVLGGVAGLGDGLQVAIAMTKEGWTSQPASVTATSGIIIGIRAECVNNGVE
mgnify:CR=1 FL=1